MHWSISIKWNYQLISLKNFFLILIFVTSYFQYLNATTIVAADVVNNNDVDDDDDDDDDRDGGDDDGYAIDGWFLNTNASIDHSLAKVSEHQGWQLKDWEARPS